MRIIVIKENEKSLISCPTISDWMYAMFRWWRMSTSPPSARFTVLTLRCWSILINRLNTIYQSFYDSLVPLHISFPLKNNLFFRKGIHVLILYRTILFIQLQIMVELCLAKIWRQHKQDEMVLNEQSWGIFRSHTIKRERKP